MDDNDKILNDEKTPEMVMAEAAAALAEAAAAMASAANAVETASAAQAAPAASAEAAVQTASEEQPMPSIEVVDDVPAAQTAKAAQAAPAREKKPTAKKAPAVKTVPAKKAAPQIIKAAGPKATAGERGKALEHKKEEQPLPDDLYGIGEEEEAAPVKAAPKKKIISGGEAYQPGRVMEQTAAQRMKDKAAKEADPRSIASKQEKLKAQPVGKKKVNESNSGLKLLYQPIFEPAKNTLVGFECLLRIYDIELGILTPGMFLDVAQKDAKLIKRLEDWSVEEVLRASKKLKEQNLHILSVNISTKHFFDADFVEMTSRLIEKSETRPQNIYFEFREEVLSGPYVEVVNKFAALQALGIKIAIDDFGTNYFAGDKKPDFSLDMVKLPFSLVKQFMDDRRAKSLIRIILAYAKQKKIEVIALGVETKAQEEALLRMGVRRMQGYLYSKPLTTQRMSIKKK